MDSEKNKDPNRKNSQVTEQNNFFEKSQSLFNVFNVEEVPNARNSTTTETWEENKRYSNVLLPKIRKLRGRGGVRKPSGPTLKPRNRKRMIKPVQEPPTTSSNYVKEITEYAIRNMCEVFESCDAKEAILLAASIQGTYSNFFKWKLNN